MKRNTTLFILCGLLILADSLALWETLASMRPDRGLPYTAIAGESFAALGIAAVLVLLVRKKYRRQKRPANRWRLEIVRPLRRLFVSASS